jgi:hypothetical protein
MPTSGAGLWLRVILLLHSQLGVLRVLGALEQVGCFGLGITPVHRPSQGPSEPEGDTRYMSFSRVGPNQTIKRGQIRVAKSPHRS